MTRKQLILQYLKARPNQWVPGMDLFNQYVGGSRGTSRIHELRREGYVIERRPSKECAAIRRLCRSEMVLVELRQHKRIDRLLRPARLLDHRQRRGPPRARRLS